MTVVIGTYDFRLVALSVALATLASYAALDLAGRVASVRGRAQAIWLSAGAAAMGLGIWAMHYIAMLALAMPMPVSYHLPTVALSLFTAIASSGVALFVVARHQKFWQEAAGSAVMGSGIAALHYIGMAAMRCSAVITYDPRIVAFSVGLAIALSFVALKLAFRVRDEQHTSLRKMLSALLMGCAIALMHYSGMWAASFHSSTVAPDLTDSIGISTIGIVAISASSFLVLGVAIASSVFDRLRAAQKGDLNLARERESYFQTMAEAVPEIIWTAGPEGLSDFFNQRCLDYTGLTFEQMLGTGWQVIIHPDDLEGCVAVWGNSLSTGEPFEMEYRLRGKDGTFKWFLVRANPIRDSGREIVKWFGTCTDIEAHKQNQQILEEQILERTMQLAEVNALLQEEMIEKDLARKERDQQHEQMMTQLRERSQRATMLAKLGELLQSCLTREEVLAAALGFAPRIFPTVRGAVALLNPSRSLTEVIGSWCDCYLPLAEFDPTACWALRTGQAHLVVAGDSTAQCGHAAGVNHTYLCIPILAQGETLGILHFQATSEAPELESSEVSFKTTFAAQLGLSIANIRLREALRTQSVRDALTGLYNRRYLDEILERELRRAGRAHQSLGILMIDLDHFKSFNDTYGHEAGDAVLRETAAALTKFIREEDFVCRYGGEEFVVVLPTASLEISISRGERLCAFLRDMTVMHDGKLLGKITISVGMAAFPEHGTSPKELLASADAALYEAKRRGRDQVVVASSKAVEEVVS